MSTNIPSDNVGFSWKISEWFPELGSETIKKLHEYANLLVLHNKTQNLVGAKTIQFLDALHFSDSILSYGVIFKDSPEMDHLYDLGSGSGFPGLVYAILNSNIKVSLVDSDKRKIDFLNTVVTKLHLKNVEVLNSAVENLPADSIKYAVSRGIANVSKSILIARKCISKGGKYYHIKNEQWGLEVGEIPIQLCSIWNPALVNEYKIPNIPIKFAVIKTTKN